MQLHHAHLKYDFSVIFANSKILTREHSPVWLKVRDSYILECIMIQVLTGDNWFEVLDTLKSVVDKYEAEHGSLAVEKLDGEFRKL